MIEMSSGIGATAMGMGVSGGSSSGPDSSGCRLRGHQISSSASTPGQQQQRMSVATTAGNGNSSQQQPRHAMQPRSKKDNCCLCWCCCCSCSNKCLAAVGTGGSGGPASMRPGAGAGGLGSGEHSSGTGLAGDLGDLGGLEADLSKTSLDEIRLWGSSFDRLMRHPAGCKLFKEFLVSEYSDENIAFWLACEQLKRESNPEKVEEKAKVIYEDYISIISPKEVSLDSRVRDIVNRNMTHPTPHTFDEAQLQIYTLMHRDSYPRFVNSELYQRVARMSGPPSPCTAESGKHQKQQQQQQATPDSSQTIQDDEFSSSGPQATAPSAHNRKPKKSIT